MEIESKHKKICVCGSEMIKVKVPTIPLKEDAEPKLLNGYHCEECGSGYTVEEDDLILLRKKIMVIYKEQDRLKKELEENLKILREKCAHESIIECPYQPENAVFYAGPPKRMCIVCGLVEDGWGVGYKILTKDPIKNVPRDEFFGKLSRPARHKIRNRYIDKIINLNKKTKLVEESYYEKG